MSRNHRHPMANNTEIETWKKQSETGDPTALARIRTAIRENPELIGRLGGDLCRNAERLSAAGVGCERQWMAAAVEGQLEHLRSRLEADSADQPLSAMESMLIDRVVTCWLTLHALEQESAIQFNRAPGHPPLLDKAVDRAHRRFVHAIEALARMRRLDRLLEIHITVDARLSTARREASAPKQTKIEENGR